MSDTEFFPFIFDNWIQYSIITLICVFICYKAINKLTFGIIDPAHYFFAFGSGTAYAVIVTLYINGFISNSIAIMVIINFIALILFWRWSYKINIKSNLGYSRSFLGVIDSNYNVSFSIIVIVYVLLTSIYIMNVSFASFGESRFEANKGLGFIVRVLDVIRLLLSSMIAIKAYKSSDSVNRALYIFIAVIIAVVSSVVSGAKFSLLEHALVSATAIYIFSGRKIKMSAKLFLVCSILLTLMIAYVLYFLTFTSESIGYTSSQYTNFPVVFELFFMRIIANGDAYYFSLPYNTIDSISVGNPFIQLFGYVMGSGAVGSLFSYDYSANDVGRLIWMKWYPLDTIARGPTSHFDLAGYVYFGVIGGIIMTSIIGFILGRISKAKDKNAGCKNDFTSAFIAVLYIRSLQLLLSPPVGIAYIIDMFIFVFLLAYLIVILNLSSRYRHVKE